MYCSATSVAATNQTQPIKQAHKIVLKSLPCLMSTLLLQCQVLLHVVRQAAKKEANRLWLQLWPLSFCS